MATLAYRFVLSQVSAIISGMFGGAVAGALDLYGLPTTSALIAGMAVALPVFVWVFAQAQARAT